jgi:hypothetical protein
MARRNTLTIRVPKELKDRIETLAAHKQSRLPSRFLRYLWYASWRGRRSATTTITFSSSMV